MEPSLQILLDPQRAFAFLNSTNPYKEWAAPTDFCSDAEKTFVNNLAKLTSYFLCSVYISSIIEHVWESKLTLTVWLV